MAIEAKMGLIGQIEQKIGGLVTADAMPQILAAVADLLDGYEVTEIRRDDPAEKDEMLDYYLGALGVQGRSRKAIDRYRYVIGRMLDTVGKPSQRVTVYDLRSYLSHEQQRGLADSSLEGSRQIFCGYFGWLQREGLIERDPAGNLGVIKVAKKVRKAYTQVELDRLHKACETVRDRAIIAFLESTGCRVGEMTELNRDQVDLERMRCVVHGKGNKERTVYMTQVAASLLRQYLAERMDHEKALFVSVRGAERMQPGGIRILLRKIGKRAGVEHVHPHKFRRTLATRIVRHGMKLQDAATILGHEKLDTTMRYVEMCGDDVESAYRRLA